MNTNYIQINSAESKNYYPPGFPGSNNEVPFFVNISMTFYYEEPVINQINLNFLNICMDIIKNPLYNESVNGSIDRIDLEVFSLTNPPYELDNRIPISYYPIVHLVKSLGEDPDFFRYGCHPYAFSSVIPINPPIELIKESGKTPFMLRYILKVYGEDFNIQREGDTNFYYPIRILDSVEEMNMRFNKTMLTLTGVLIILGSFPFFAALKQLLKKDEEKRI